MATPPQPFSRPWSACVCASGVETRIIGWYHSHPHITVLPSHVDLSTQAMYQSLEARFIGLIFSVFNTNATTKAQTAQVCGRTECWIHVARGNCRIYHPPPTLMRAPT